MPRTRKTEVEVQQKKEEMNISLEELKKSISEGVFDDELKKFIKTSEVNYEEFPINDCFKLLLNKYNRKEFKFTKIWG